MTGAMLSTLWVFALAWLISLNKEKKIIKELHYGEAMKLLKRNVAAASTLFLIVAIFSITSCANPSALFESFYSLFLICAALELALTGFYLTLVVWKIFIQGPHLLCLKHWCARRFSL